ncbi:MAG: hypothetical protein K2Y09_10585 [Nitrosomonas sp.]|uniref:hypothetical protein n=1 Tax=Nitrosomonas sp. TaxID=42353 RepID=UPI001D75AAAF|nr:hypothetical protein [Nitrosomonas sp.]MBX9895612.1 hypothetical protein [Nitrosomonas sp.]
MSCSEKVMNGSLAKQPERARYFPQQLVTAELLTCEQNYHREKRRLHNRLLHGWGIICGLEVKPPPSGAGLVVTVCPGYALNPEGDEIYVPTEVRFDLARCITNPNADHSSPCASAAPGTVDPSKAFYLAIRYDECESHPVRVPAIGCGCDETGCEYSRTREGFELFCLENLPDSYSIGPLPPVIGPERVIPCPVPADFSWLVLATVTLNSDRSGVETIAGDKRRLLSPPQPMASAATT